MTDETDGPTDAEPPHDRRKGGDRRKAQVPHEGPDRRKGERRSGEDRRTNPRH